MLYIFLLSLTSAKPFPSFYRKGLYHVQWQIHVIRTPNMQSDCDVHCAAGVTWHVNGGSSAVINIPSGASADKGGGRECVGMGVIWEIP